MHTREARRWMRAEPKARALTRLTASLSMVTRYVPQLRGRDIAVPGQPDEYDTPEAAIECAKLFQRNIKKNHPDAIE